MAITAGMVKELREISGAGMMDCKKALAETNGDMEEAIEYLRKNGQAKAEKKANRIAAEGLVKVLVEGQTAAIVEVNSETDFVAKNEEFQNFVSGVAHLAIKTSTSNIDDFLGEAWLEDTSKTVNEVLTEKIAVIGEKLSIRRFEKVTADQGCVVSYTHGGGRIGVVVKANAAIVNEEVTNALSNIAMQIAALAPKYVSTDEVSEEYKEHEKEILKAQIATDPKMQGKPDKVIEGAIIGRLNKELKEVCLLEQAYVKAEDGKQTVKAYLQEISKTIGSDVSIEQFIRFETGEGIEKKQENFADEVKAQIGQ
ncbi:MAG: translation elongation factor Ts [Eubacteriales bacterium]